MNHPAKTIFFLCVCFAISCFGLAAKKSTGKHPNMIIFMLDDVGYGDIGCFGGKRAATPHLDKMAAEGMRMTDFYVHPVCGVTRASLLTGSYAMRVAEVGNRKNGHPILHPKEITIAEVMREAGYRTGMVGKWHLAGSTRKEYPPELMPNAQGFDYFYGAPLHNGFTRTIEGSRFRMQLMRQNKVLDQSIDQSEMDQVTKLYTEEAVKFIQDSAKGDKPFMLYLAHTMAHVVIGATDPFRGRSGGGLYGDVIEELDWSAGEVIKALKQAKVDDNTLMVFTSDNGPWIEQQLKGKGGNDAHYGTSGPLRGAKMMTWEGGVRVPTVVRWPGVVPAGKECSEPATIMDLLPTFAKLGGGKIPDDRKIDGHNIMHLFRGDTDAKSPHEAIYHYSYVHLQAVRSGKWKLVLPRPAKPKWTLWSARMTDAVEEVQLFDLQTDIGETKNLAKEHPDVVGRLMKLIENAREDIGDYDRIGMGARFFDSAPKRPRSVFGRSAPVTPPLKNKPFAPLGNLRFDFESGDLQGWRVVEGAFSQPVSSALSLPRWQKDPFDRQGKFHLSTIALKDDSGVSDAQVGVIESPRFRLTGDRIAFLIGGGFRDDVHLSICDGGGKEIARSGGINGPRMVRRVVHLPEYKGKILFLRIIDRATKGWGHILLDDFSAQGEHLDKN
ncbi:MAG: sulfatase [Opitutales bacterium]|nr:sulfatase [Opitutales bacterium]